VVIVSGSVTAQYSPKYGRTIEFVLLQSNRGMENSEATNVPGRKIIVTSASVFMAEESPLECIAMTLETRASSRLTKASFWAMMLES
jgi:hypothetical protein